MSAVSVLRAVRNLGRSIASHPLTRDRQWRAYARFVQWQVRSRMHGEVIVPWIGNVKLAARRGMTGATGNIYMGLQEFDDMAFVLHFLRKGDLFADIGANVGTYTLLASGVCGASTIAFEPDPPSFASLCRNVFVNGLDNVVSPRRLALGAAAGEVAFTVGLQAGGHIVHEGSEATQTVPMDTLDSCLDGRVPTMIKMDVEGFEADVLRGARRTFESRELQALAIEAQLDGTQPQEIAAFLAAMGFREMRYRPKERRLVAPDYPPAWNSLFVRDPQFVQQRLAAAPKVRVLGVDL